jgi:gluconokinase
MKAAVILALDLGTSSTRAAIFDACGRRLLETTAQVAYPLLSSADGRAELRPRDLQRAVEQVVREALAAWRRGHRHEALAAIGVSCFWHSLLGLDARGEPVTPVFTWADSRCRAQAEALRRRPGEAHIHARTGCMARASFWPAKLLWLRATQPALFKRVARWVSPAEWIQELWCGGASVSFSMASGTGLLDGHTLAWSPELLRRCRVTPRQLNPLSDEPGKVTRGLARRHPELAGVPWFPAIGDGVASNLGSGATEAGKAAINVGTSAAVRVVLGNVAARARALAPFGLFAYRVDERRRLLGGAVSNAGNLRAWALRELKLPADATRIERLLARRNQPVNGLTVLPFWLAERAPTWPEDLPSVITGISYATTALDLLQALQEATYHRLEQIVHLLEKETRRPLALVVSGGIQHSRQALQRLANVMGRPVFASPEPEASLRGAACFALGKIGQTAEAPKLGRPLRPSRAAAEGYAQARERQIALEEKMRLQL